MELFDKRDKKKSNFEIPLGAYYIVNYWNIFNKYFLFTFHLLIMTIEDMYLHWLIHLKHFSNSKASLKKSIEIFFKAQRQRIKISDISQLDL